MTVLPARLALGLLAGLAPALCVLHAQDAPSVSGGERWGAAYFPNVPLITHEGKHVRFFDDLVKDKVVVINFIYTSCVDACPLETARLAEVQEILGERVGQDVFMYSISIDPKKDTPAVLAEYVERFQIEPGWLFLTGEEKDITELRQKLGLYIDLVQPNGKKDHNLSVVIGNQKTGRWMKTSPFENSYVLAAKIGDWLHNWKNPHPDAPDFSEAPELRMVSRGESLFRTRCSTCHVIGPGDGKPRQGPNLLGVMQRRERDWLMRWIAAPDAMLAAGDPIATGLFESFNKVQMPNLRLNELEVTALIDYLDTEGARVAQVERVLDELPVAEEEGGLAPCCQKQDTLVIERGVEQAAQATPAEVAASSSAEDEPLAHRPSGPMLDETLDGPLTQEAEPEPLQLLAAEPAVEPVPALAATEPAAPDAAVDEPAPARAWHLPALSKLSIAAGLLLGAATLLAARRGRAPATVPSA